MKKTFTLIALLGAIYSTSFASGTYSCDTLFNLTSPLDTITYYFAAGHADSGYVSGNNFYGDLAKVEGFPAIVGDSVTAADLFFAIAGIGPGDSNKLVTVGVWDNTGTSDAGNAGAPGNMIDSAHVTLAQIAAAVTATRTTQQYTPVTVFFNGVKLTGDTFYVGVVLPSSADTIAFWTNEVPPGPDGNGWEQNSDGSWGTYNNDWGFTSGSEGVIVSEGNFIVAVICGGNDSTAGIVQLNNNQRVSVYPNPATDMLNLVFSERTNADVSVIDLNGRVMSTITINGDMQSTYDIHNLASGAYILRITDKTTNQQQSTLITKF